MKHILACLTVLVMCSTHNIAHAQWMPLGNNGLNAVTHFLGCTDGVPVNFRTDNLLRARINNSVSYTVGSFGAQNADGYLGISPNNTLWTNGPGPFSRLHLHDGTTAVLSASYRPWMDNGISFTTNSDQMFVGHKVESGSDQTSAVVQWGDNEGSGAGPDVMKFIFTSGYLGGGTPTTINGREIARMHPAGLLGVGDWQNAGLQPTERVDLMNGRLRIRQLPSDLEAANAYKVMVVDDSTDPLERGVVKWKDISTMGDCDWVEQPPLFGPHISSVYDGSSCNWDMKYGVGIGVPVPKMKLQVMHTEDAILDRIAISGSSRFNLDQGQEVIGVLGEARTSNQEVSTMKGIGVLGDTEGAKYAIGVEGRARMDAYTNSGGDFAIGVAGFATAAENVNICIGVYGKAGGAINGQDWAAFFEGFGYISTPFWSPSDEDLKTDINVMEGVSAMESIMALQPKTYRFNTEQNSTMGLPAGPQRGFLSQEVEAVLPDLVKDVHRPPVVDSTGVELEPAMDFKAMNYEGLIPILVAAMQEQQGTIDEQNAHLATMEQRLNDCCTRPADDGTRSNTTEAPLDNTLNSEGDRKLQIVPNPFETSTTVYYQLERSGRLQLLANSADGKELRVLKEANTEAGNYQFEWTTGDLAPGMYNVTLLLDGQPITKRAVKIAR